MGNPRTRRADFALTLPRSADARTDPAGLHEQLPPPNEISSARAEEISSTLDDGNRRRIQGVTRAEYIALIAQVTALHARVAAIEGAARHRHGSVTVTDEQLLIAVAAAVAARAFSAAEVMQHAVYDESLRHALAVAGISNARRLGKLFRRFEGLDIAGLQLQRIGAERDGVVWQVART